MRGELILHVIHIAGTRMVGVGIYGLSRDNNLGGIMRGMNPLHFVLLYQGAVVRLAKLGPWISIRWGEILSSLNTKDWFEHKGYNILWGPHPDTTETELEVLL